MRISGKIYIFKVFESEHFKKQAGLLTFTPSVSEWVEQTNAIGVFVKKRTLWWNICS